MFKFIDIHSHLNLPEFKEDSDVVIAKLKALDMATIVIGVDKETSEEAVKIAEGRSNMFVGIGLHPTDNHKEEFDVEFYRALASNPKVVAIGECGLDYFRLRENIALEIDRQKEIFKNQIELALEMNLPLMLHCRPNRGTMDAYEDVLEILESCSKEKKPRGNVHFFVGNEVIAKRFLDLGFTFSFTGVLTFARDYDDVVRFLPLDRILSETDAPFVAPVPYRGKRCEPQYVEEVVRKIAEIRGEDFEVVRSTLAQNAVRVFGLAPDTRTNHYTLLF